MRDLIFDDETLIQLTPWPALIDALREAFRIPCEMPQRSNLQIPLKGAIPGAEGDYVVLRESKKRPKGWKPPVSNAPMKKKAATDKKPDAKAEAKK